MFDKSVSKWKLSSSKKILQFTCIKYCETVKKIFRTYCTSSLFSCSKLGLHLPHPVDHKTGKAQWDSAKQTLTVTLRMVRDFDFVNF